MKQPNLGYADVKLDFVCMHPAGCPCRVSPCVYYDLCGSSDLSLNPRVCEVSKLESGTKRGMNSIGSPLRCL